MNTCVIDITARTVSCLISKYIHINELYFLMPRNLKMKIKKEEIPIY